MPRVTANGDTLMQQAPSTVALYLREAVAAIDGQFGDGYARSNRDLVAVFITACTNDLHTAMLACAIQDLADAVKDLDFYDRTQP